MGDQTNYWTYHTRYELVLELIIKNNISRLLERNLAHILVYSEGNKVHLTCSFEASSINTFNNCEIDRGFSMKIPIFTLNIKKGYYENWRTVLILIVI